MPTTSVTVSAVEEFAAVHQGETLTTQAQKAQFTVQPAPLGNGIRIELASGNYIPENSQKIAEYLKYFNSAAEESAHKTTIYPQTGRLRARSYMARIFCEIRDGHRVQQEEADLQTAKGTTRSALILARQGQGRFRDDLLTLRRRCYVTGITDARFLVASHIKPWRISTPNERLDPSNGLLLTPIYDHLFDAHLISFEDDGRMIVSKNLPKKIIAALGIHTSVRGSAFDTATSRFLALHQAELRRQERTPR